MDRRHSERNQEVKDLEQRATAIEKDKDSLNTQLEGSRQQVAELEQQLSARIQEIQGLEQRANAAERERGNVTSLYFKLKSELEQAGEEASELEQQLSARNQEVQHLEQSAAAAEKERDDLNRRVAASGPGFVRKLLGSVEIRPATTPKTIRPKGPRLGILRRIPKLKSKSTQQRSPSGRCSVTVVLPPPGEPRSDE